MSRLIRCGHNTGSFVTVWDDAPSRTTGGKRSGAGVAYLVDARRQQRAGGEDVRNSAAAR